MTQWDNSVATFKTNEKNANDRLAVQFAAQGRAQRAYAFNKIKGLVAQTAAQFNDVSLKMAKNRHEVDMALRQASVRFEAALNEICNLIPKILFFSAIQSFSTLKL